MSFETIRVYRDLPVINNYVALPPNQESDKNTFYCGADCGANMEVVVPGSEIVKLGGGTGNETGSKHGAQRFVRLPGITPNEWYATDPVQDMTDAANAFDGDIDVE